MVWWEGPKFTKSTNGEPTGIPKERNEFWIRRRWRTVSGERGIPDENIL